MITVGVVDDNEGVRRGLERLFASRPGFKCLFTCASGDEALRVVPEQPPAVLLMDIEMPGMSGIECLVRLKSVLPELLVIMFTVNENDEKVFQSLRAGACGYLLKRTSSSEILEALSDVAAGGAPMSSSIARKVLTSFHAPPAAKADQVELSPRERELLDLISTGISSKEAAVMMHLTLSSVYEYLKHIYEKLHVHSRTEAVLKHLGRQSLPTSR